MSVFVPKPSVEGIVWPSLPGRRVTAILAILFQLEHSQWWPSEKIRGLQFRQLGRLLAHAYRTVPFYRERQRKAGLTAKAPLTPEQWAEIPLLQRQDIQAAGPALHSTRVPDGHGRVSTIFTSGSTGKPIGSLRTELTGLFWESFTLRDHLWHRRDPTQKLAAIRSAKEGASPYPDGSVGRWGFGSDAIFNAAPAISLNINCTVEQQVEWLQRQNPAYLLTFPSNVLRLAKHCLEKGIELRNLRQVQAISEVLGAEIRAACRQAWGVPVTDLYSSREVGYMALQCPDHEHHHVQAEGVLVEIVDDRGRACAPGEVGKVVVTPLHNFAMPLLRYEIGDYAEVGESCSCGRGLPVLRRILGRVQNMVVLPSGERHWTLLSSENIGAFLDIAPIRQYQFVQKNLQSIESRLVVERDLTPEEEDHLRKWIVNKLGHPFEVTFTYHEEIARSASGKYQDFISEVET